MKQTFVLLIGAAALAVSAPAFAKPGHGKGDGKFKADKVKVVSHSGHRGQRYNRNYGNLWSYNQIPYDLRSRYDFDQSSRYYYRDGYVYRVNPRTMLVQQVVSALLR